LVGVVGIVAKSEVEAAGLAGVSHQDSSSEEAKACGMVFFVPYMPINGTPNQMILIVFPTPCSGFYNGFLRRFPQREGPIRSAQVLHRIFWNKQK
jgi:hypothetical protein